MRAGTVLCAALAAVFLLSATALASPKLELSSDVWDFGEIYQWTNPSITIAIKNAGDAPLEITDVTAACGCTATFLSSKKINPGDKGFIKIQFASYALTGKVNKIVRLTTNDPAASRKDIMVKGFVKSDKAAVGSLDKEYVDLGVVAPYETRSLEVLIKNSGNIELDIGHIELPDGWSMDSPPPIKVKVRDLAAVHFDYKPPKHKGPIDDAITINTSGIGGGKLTFRVVGYIAECSRGGDFVVLTPSGFTTDSAGKSPLTFSVKNDGGSTVTMEGIDSSLDLSWSANGASEIEPGSAATFKLDVDPAGLEPGTRGYVYIRLGLPVYIK